MILFEYAHMKINNFFIKFQVKPLSKSEPSVKTLAVLLPCREKGSKTTKIWLRRLQQYLYYHHKGQSPSSQFKILTLFSCHARHKLAIMERPDLAGILSFEPRPSARSSNLEAEAPLSANVTEVIDKKNLTLFFFAFGLSH